MREKKLYRDTLAWVNERFGKALIPIKEVSEWLQLDRETLLKEFDFKQYGNRWKITAVALAKGLS